MPKEVLIKSKERVRKFAEVFTPSYVVRNMCDMLEQESPGAFEPSKTFLEPTCGDGNFIVEILRRKFRRCVMRQDFTTALKSVYGMDIQADNIAECIQRVTALCKQYFKPTKEELQIISDHYIMCDSLKVMRLLAESEDMKMQNVVYTSDMVHVVRCGKCVWGKPYGKLIGCENENCGHSPASLVDADWFCADGERMDGI